ncbi:hypothetical protein Tco_1278344 [Tanacetum coccineum]
MGVTAVAVVVVVNVGCDVVGVVVVDCGGDGGDEMRWVASTGGYDRGGNEVRNWVAGIWTDVASDMLEREESVWWLGL